MINVDPEAPDLKARWVQTRDVRFAAMAIGRWPSDPPVWAVLACCGATSQYERKTSRGYNKAEDGKVLDEVIRVYFRHEDEAHRVDIGFRPSTYTPPDQKVVIAEALLNIEGLDHRHDLDIGHFRARAVAIERRLMEEEEDEGFPQRAADGARETRRYRRILIEWGLDNYGGPPHLHQVAIYLNKVIDDET